MLNLSRIERLKTALVELQNDVSEITPIKVMANPMKIQKTALDTLGLIGDLLDIIENGERGL